MAMTPELYKRFKTGIVITRDERPVASSTLTRISGRNEAKVDPWERSQMNRAERRKRDSMRRRYKKPSDWLGL